MSHHGEVRYETSGAIARITFDRPGARNALTWEMYDQLADALSRLDAEPEVRVAQLRGTGGHFVAGTDIGQFASFSSGDDGVKYERRLEAVISRLEAVRVPTVAVVQGHAAGAGLLLATACDIRVSTPDARFSVPIARTVGNTLSLPAIARLIAQLGPSRTKALIMTASAIDAAEAHTMGFVHSVIEPDRLDDGVAQLLSRLAEMAPLTLRATKRLTTRVLDSPTTAEADDIVREVYGSRDFREGVRAFVDRRAPSWEGR